MSARETLRREMTHNHLYMTDERADELINAFAHEMAEQIRAERGSGTYEPGVYFHGGMDYAADIIDPHASAGPVRPDEEPTT